MLVASRRLWWGVPILLVLLACLGALLPETATSLPQAPALTSAGLPVVRFVRDCAAALTVGSLLVGGLMVPRSSPRVLRWSSGWALVWLVALVAQAVLAYSDIVAVGLAQALDPAALWSFLTSVLVGQVFLWQGIAVLLVLALGRAVISRPTAWVVLVIALVGAVLPALVAHLSAGHVAATLSLAVHLAAISLWLGGLAAVVALLRVEPQWAPTVLPRFSAVALGAVVVVGESGLLNGSLLLSSPAQMLGTDYGGLLLTKVAVLLALVLLGWQQRSRVVPPAREGEPGSLLMLARIAGWEFLAMGAAVALGVTMARVGVLPAGQSTYVVNPLCVAVLAGVLPMLASQALRVGDQHAWVRVVRRYPELTAVLLALVIIEVAGVALTTELLGPDLGAVVGAILLASAGWLMAVALQGERPWVGRVAAAVAWLVSAVVVYVFEVNRAGHVLDPWLAILAVVLAVACVVVPRPQRTSEQDNVGNPAPEPAHG